MLMIDSSKSFFPTKLQHKIDLKIFLAQLQNIKSSENEFIASNDTPTNTKRIFLSLNSIRSLPNIIPVYVDFYQQLPYIYNTKSTLYNHQIDQTKMYFNFVQVPHLFYLQQQPFQIYSLYEAASQISQEHTVQRYSDYMQMEQKAMATTTYQTLDLENKEGQQKTIPPSSPIVLAQKNIGRKRNPTKILQSAKKNSQNNIIKQFFNNICIRRSSQALLVKIIERSKIAFIPAQKLLNFIYSLVFYIKEENKRKYMNTNGLLYQLSHAAIYEYSSHLKSTFEEDMIDIESLSKAISTILMVFLRNYLKNVCPLAILTSKRIVQNAKYHHLRRQREILDQMGPFIKKQ